MSEQSKQKTKKSKKKNILSFLFRKRKKPISSINKDSNISETDLETSTQSQQSDCIENNTNNNTRSDADECVDLIEYSTYNAVLREILLLGFSKNDPTAFSFIIESKKSEKPEDISQKNNGDEDVDFGQPKPTGRELPIIQMDAFRAAIGPFYSTVESNSKVRLHNLSDRCFTTKNAIRNSQSNGSGMIELKETERKNSIQF